MGRGRYGMGEATLMESSPRWRSGTRRWRPRVDTQNLPGVGMINLAQLLAEVGPMGATGRSTGSIGVNRRSR